jgi:hypothetical protein
MASCDLCDTCRFFNRHETDLPLTKDFLIKQYCKGDRYKECALYRIAKSYGMDKVPTYLYPNVFIEMVDGTTFEAIQPRGGTKMIKVIYTDGRMGMARDSNLGKLIKLGKIAAYKPFDDWIEIRRKRTVDFKGPDKRVGCLF